MHRPFGMRVISKLAQKSALTHAQLQYGEEYYNYFLYCCLLHLRAESAQMNASITEWG